MRRLLAIALVLAPAVAHAVSAMIQPPMPPVYIGGTAQVQLGAARVPPLGGGMTLSLPTPPSLTLVSVTDPNAMATASCPAGGPIGPNYSLSCAGGNALVTVVSDMAVPVQVRANYQANTAGTVNLTVTVKCTNDCGAGLTASTMFDVVAYPATVAIDAAAPTAPVGGDAVFNLTYTNGGTLALAGAQVALPLPADTAVDAVVFNGTSVQPGADAWSAPAGGGEAQLMGGKTLLVRPANGDLAAGAAFAAQVKLKVLPTAKENEALVAAVTATATATGATVAPSTAQAKVTVASGPPLYTLAKSADRARAARGDHVGWTVTLTPQAGATAGCSGGAPCLAVGDTVVDKLPDGLSLAALKVSSGGAASAVACTGVASTVGPLAVTCPAPGGAGGQVQVALTAQVNAPVRLLLDTVVRPSAPATVENRADAADPAGQPLAAEAVAHVDLDGANLPANLLVALDPAVATRGDLVQVRATVGAVQAVAGAAVGFAPGAALRPFGKVDVAVEGQPPTGAVFQEGMGGVVTVPVGAIPAGKQAVVTFRARVGVRAVIGPQAVTVSLSDGATAITSASATVRVEPEPDFDLATIVGTVWRDENGDGKRSADEPGIAGATVVMDDGVSAVTDGDGRYHIAAVVPGQRAIKLAAHTLAPGARLTTDGTRIVAVTPGIVTVVDYGVSVPPPEPPAARLTAAPEPLPELSIADAGHLRYRLSGAATPGARVFVDGKPATIDARGGWRADVTLARGRTRLAIVTAHADGRVVIGARDVLWLERAEGGSMIVPRPEDPRLVLRFPPGALPDPRFTLEGAVLGDARVTALTVAGAQLAPDRAGRLRANLHLPDEAAAGIPVEVAFSDGVRAKYQHVLETGGDFVFLVGVAEGKLGYVVKDGPAAPGERGNLGDGLYAQGRVALYAKGRIQGRYLLEGGLDIDSSALSDWRDLFRGDPTRMFRSLDPDRFYPVYGDASATTQNAPTRGALFVRIAVDRSQLVLGNFQTGFTGVEFGRYQRSLTGGRLDFVLAGKTPDGPPLTRVVVFGAWLQTARAHDELRGSGGSLYYLSRRMLVEGSAQVRVELRDMLSDRPIDNRALRVGVDYEIDHVAGRITLREPLASIAAGQSLVRSGPLDGTRAYLIADYEYVVTGAADDAAVGVRATQQIGPVRLGGTFASEPTQGYYLFGGDAQIDLGRFGGVVGEFAHSEGRQAALARSDDGGLTWLQSAAAAPAPGDVQQGNAWKAEGDLHLGPVNLRPYVRGVDAGFTDSAHAQDFGLLQFGGEASAEFWRAKLRLHYDERRYDFGQPAGVDALRRDVGGDFGLKLGRFTLALGARAEEVADPDPTKAGHRETVAAKVGFDVSARLNLYALGQYTVEHGGPGLAGQDVSMGALGAIAKLPWDFTANAEASYGAQGVGGLVGLKRDLGPGRALYGTYTITQDRDDIVSSALAVGGRERVAQTPLTVFAEDQFRDGRDSPASTETRRAHMQAVGADLPLDKRLNLGASFERGQVSGAADVLTRTAGALHGSFVSEKVRVQVKAEVRQDVHDGGASFLSWLASGAVTLKPHRDLTLTGKALFSRTSDGSPADAARTGELSCGFAWRPSFIDGAALLGRYAWLDDAGPAQQEAGAGASFAERAHAFSLGGEARVFWRFSVGEKVAAKLRQDPAGDQWMILSVTRVSLHVTRRIDAVGEYRLLTQPGLGTQQGVAVEANYLLFGHLRVGAGYNFADFSDDELQLGRGSQHGFFVRAQGYY